MCLLSSAQKKSRMPRLRSSVTGSNPSPSMGEPTGPTQTFRTPFFGAIKARLSPSGERRGLTRLGLPKRTSRGIRGMDGASVMRSSLSSRTVRMSLTRTPASTGRVRDAPPLPEQEPDRERGHEPPAEDDCRDRRRCRRLEDAEGGAPGPCRDRVGGPGLPGGRWCHHRLQVQDYIGGGRAAFEVLDPALHLLDLAADVRQFPLDGERVFDALGPFVEREEALLSGEQVSLAGLQIHELLRYVLALHGVCRDPLTQAAQLLERRLELPRRDGEHQVGRDRARPRVDPGAQDLAAEPLRDPPGFFRAAADVLAPDA